jgi:cytochrome P450
MSVENNSSLSLSNLLRPEIRANPYPLYQQIRSTDPVHWDEPMGFWVLTRYADIVTALRDSRFSKAQGMAVALNRLPEAEQETARPLYDLFSKQMLYADPPYHTQLRGLVNKAFTPRMVEKMRAHIQQIVDELLDAVQDHGRMDVIWEFAYPLPMTVTMELLGLPPEDREQFKKWSDDFMAIIGVVRREAHLMEKARQSLVEFADYIGNLQEQRRQHPQDDLLGALFSVEEEGNKLSHEEVVANSILLLAAGHETTTNLIGNSVLALLRHPDQMQKLKDDPALITTAVEELLRYDNPVQIMWRLATEDLEIGDKRINQGQMVNFVVGAANRDPVQFPNPDRLDLSRLENRHAGFGFGIHFCLGAPLARLEGEIAINTVLRRLPNLQLETEALEWQESPTFRGVKALPVAF